MPLAPQITNTPIPYSTWYVSTDYDYDSGGIAVVQATSTFVQATQPNATAIGDVWFDSSNGYKQWRWNGSSWVTVQDTAIATANTNASNALTSANGKNTVFYGSSTPTALAVGDLWFDGSNTNRPNQWNGSAWVPFGLGYLAVTSIDANNITTGTLNSRAINNGAFTVSTTGAVTASNITITGGSLTIGTTFAVSSAGSLTATSGTIGGWTITSSNLANSGTTTVLTANPSGTGNALVTGFGVSAAFGTIGSGTNANGYSFSVGGTCNVGGAITTSSNISASGTITAAGDLYAQQAISASTTAATNCYITSTGQIRKTSTTSSQRYKTDIVPIAQNSDLDPKKLLNIPVMSFKYKPGYLPDDDQRNDMNLPGFIAETVAQIYPVAADIVNGQIETWGERWIVPGLLALIQDQEKRIAQLENKGITNGSTS